MSGYDQNTLYNNFMSLTKECTIFRIEVNELRAISKISHNCKPWPIIITIISLLLRSAEVWGWNDNNTNIYIFLNIRSPFTALRQRNV